MYGFNYYHSILSVSIDTGVRATELTKLSTGGITAGRQVLSNNAKVQLLDEHHRLESVRQILSEKNLGEIWQHIQIRGLLRKDKDAISMSEGINMRKRTIKVTRTMLRDSTFADIMKRVSNLAFEFEKE